MSAGFLAENRGQLYPLIQGAKVPTQGSVIKGH